MAGITTRVLQLRYLRGGPFSAESLASLLADGTIWQFGEDEANLKGDGPMTLLAVTPLDQPALAQWLDRYRRFLLLLQ